jgi:heme/copper-type cytochrome/quinol oxidase subunit 2
MSRHRVLGAFLVLGALALAVPSRGEESAAPADPVPTAAPAGDVRPIREFNLFVKEWTWEPRTLRVKKGSHVVLHIESLDGARSFVLKAYNLKVPLPEGERVTVEFDADQEGTFQFLCGRPCGNGCAKLRGSLTVH